MGRIFTLPPSPWEIQHSAGILAGMTYQAEHGSLPDTPMWRMLERRHDLNAVRFARWHPNISMIIERSNLGAVECPLVAAFVCPAVPRFPFPHHGWTGHMRQGGTLAPLTVQPAAVATIPEPSALALCCVGLAVVCMWAMKGVSR